MRVDVGSARGNCVKAIQLLTQPEKDQLIAALEKRTCPNGRGSQGSPDDHLDQTFPPIPGRLAVTIRASYRCSGRLRRKLLAFCFETVTPAPSGIGG
jgi:hypothetical protein